MHRTQLYIEKETIKALRHRAIDLEITMSELVRRILKLYLEEENNGIFKRIQK